MGHRKPPIRVRSVRVDGQTVPRTRHVLALRDGGVWMSGPILNRGAIGWQAGALPSFGRLSLEESVEDSQGRRWPLTSLNSGYVQKGLARYTSSWGRSYTPISGQEMAVLLRDGRVVQRFEPGPLVGGVPLRPSEELLVARGGLLLPWQPGETLQLRKIGRAHV